MSRIVRVCALCLFLAVLFAGPATTHAQSNCTGCQVVVWIPPYQGLWCPNWICFDAQVCAEENNCQLVMCEPDEAGALIGVIC